MGSDPVDVLIVTAVKDEWDAVLAAGGGEAAWRKETGSAGLEVAFGGFEVEGGVLEVAVTQALGMGGASAVSAAATLIRDHEVQCLAMCGVCAGKRGDVALGDVIVADRVWQYDTGKRREAGKEQGDVETFQIKPLTWKQEAERFEIEAVAEWVATRPRTYEAQESWLLERVLRGADPLTDAESTTKCADLDVVLARLWNKKLLRDGKVSLTPAGRKHIERVLLVNRGALPQAKPLRVHVGPIASGNRVMADGEVFGRLSDTVRKVLGVEMEAAAIGMLAHAREVPCAVVMKAVMDHADADKSDNFKAFAARASAEVLLAFVKKHVPPRGTGKDAVLGPGTSPLPPRANPAALLNARHQVVPFHGRGELVDEMRGWCEGGGRIRVRLVYAAGGMGKTRLAIELCRQMRGRGWRAGFVPEGDRFGELMESAQPVLAVIDYAESRPELREWMKRAVEWSRTKPLRVLLLARNADEWWAELGRADGFVADLLKEEAPIELPSIPVDREETFQKAVKAFAAQKDKGAPEDAAPSLEDRRFERVLYVHAAALAAVEGRAVAADGLLEDTLDHEERFWREQLRDRGPKGERIAVNKLRLAVTALTLTGGADSANDAECLTGEEELALLLHDLYPGRPPRYAGGLEPDLLGEAMVWRTLSREAEGAGDYLDGVFEGAGPQATRNGFVVLGRLSEDHEEAEGWIARVLGRDVARRAMDAFAAAKTVGERTAHAALGKVLAEALEREGTVELAKRLQPELPHPQQTMSLRKVGQWVLGQLLTHLPEGSAPEDRARLLNNLSVWQVELGQHNAALASAGEATALLRKLAEIRPVEFLSKLARSIDNLGHTQSKLGQREAALASTLEAVALRRELAKSRPHEFTLHLAGGLLNLGITQSELGQREAALASTLEAVSLYRKLAEYEPEAVLSDLATSQTHLGSRLSALGQVQAALDAWKEAASLFRKLATSWPEGFQHYLAGSLNNLSIGQGELGQHEAAVASAQEAVDIYRKLAKHQPEAVLSDLARSLDNLSIGQAALGRPEAALASAEAALDAIWPLFLKLPAAFEPHTHTYLTTLRKRLAALGRPPSADLLARTAEYEARRPR